jgi:hypothetical protein
VHTTALVFLLAGVACTVLGVVGMRFGFNFQVEPMHYPSSHRFSNYGAQVLSGAAMVLMGAAVLASPEGSDAPGAESSVLSQILSVPAAVLLIWALYAWLAGPPRFLIPKWQREVDEVRARGRRARREKRRRERRR